MATLELTKNDVLLLNDNDISKRKYDDIIDKISDRVDDIWKKIISMSGRRLVWYAFLNDVELGRGNGSTGGEFNPATDSEFIELIGEYSELDNHYYEYNNGFPTRFLWTEDDVWQAEVLTNINQSKEKKKIDKNKQVSLQVIEKEKKRKIITEIKSKLSKEELKYVKFI
jgi:hypothetical protein